ncbi:MAG: prepilin-type N-terminal cleavage/methylation domain-containing protein [Gallionella sp.]|nr:prepilin-type N-terminal cleavage/methylation domain-containing protein [Gallionella sp.]
MIKNRGFTLVELVMTMVIIGIISAVAVPRMFDKSIFETRGFADQVQASLRYAQKVAIAQNRFVCAAFTASSVTLSIGATSACGTPLQSPTGEASYVINAPSGVTFTTSPANFNFNPLGQPSAATSGVVGTYTITVEAQTGYVH